ncbi:MAG: hypothetical protein HC828_04335 [Blastochloris sp.]|nr:hypothetical protein [Blastochloris sp.]
MLLTLNGVPVQYDDNGNLIDDGTQQYVYDDLDRLVSVTQGITTTTFGYTGDGDRLWQEVADARTTFALDLNTALPQVLAQQSPDQSTRYLPGIGQQVGATWQYLHTDALGSIRHITGEDGSVAGSWRYSPFGEIEATNGAGSLFGYTGEPQDPSSGLTYLRARYYHPALVAS